MRFSASYPRAFPFTVLIVAAVVVAAPSLAAGKKEGETGPPRAEVVTTVDLAGELQWYYRNDVGILLVYAGDRLYRLDLLASDSKAGEPLPFPGLTEESSVLPIGRTGLMLIPATPFEGNPPGSHAIDTMTGEVVWHAPALPAIDVLFSFPDSGLALERYAECERRIQAASGKVRYFVVGPKNRYDILKIDLVAGGVTPLRRYEEDRVHALAPFPAFERAVTLENDNRRIRLLRLE